MSLLDIKSLVPDWVPNWLIETDVFLGIAPLPIIVMVIASVLTGLLCVALDPVPHEHARLRLHVFWGVP